MAFWVSKRCYCCRAASAAVTLISSHCKRNMNRVAFEFDQRWCSFQWFRFSKGLWLTPFIFFPRTDIHTVWTHCTHRSHDATSKTDIASHVPKTTFRILFLLWIFDHKCLLEVSHGGYSYFVARNESFKVYKSRQTWPLSQALIAIS